VAEEELVCTGVVQEEWKNIQDLKSATSGEFEIQEYRR
jgi:hypothetical protein